MDTDAALCGDRHLLLGMAVTVRSALEVATRHGHARGFNAGSTGFRALFVENL